MHEASQEKSYAIYLSPTLHTASRFHGEANAENRHGKYNKTEDPSRNRAGRNTREKQRIVPMKPSTSSNENSNADDNRSGKKKREKRKKTSRRGPNNWEGDTSSNNSKSFQLEESDDEKK